MASISEKFLMGLNTGRQARMDAQAQAQADAQAKLEQSYVDSWRNPISMEKRNQMFPQFIDRSLKMQQAKDDYKKSGRMRKARQLYTALNYGVDSGLRELDRAEEQARSIGDEEELYQIAEARKRLEESGPEAFMARMLEGLEIMDPEWDKLRSEAFETRERGKVIGPESRSKRLSDATARANLREQTRELRIKNELGEATKEDKIQIAKNEALLKKYEAEDKNLDLELKKNVSKKPKQLPPHLYKDYSQSQQAYRKKVDLLDEVKVIEDMMKKPEIKEAMRGLIGASEEQINKMIGKKGPLSILVRRMQNLVNTKIKESRAPGEGSQSDREFEQKLKAVVSGTANAEEQKAFVEDMKKYARASSLQQLAKREYLSHGFDTRSDGSFEVAGIQTKEGQSPDDFIRENSEELLGYVYEDLPSFITGDLIGNVNTPDTEIVTPGIEAELDELFPE